MNKNVKIGLVVLIVLVLIVGFWKLSAPKNTPPNTGKNQPVVNFTQETAPIVDENGTSGLDADLLSMTGVDEGDDSAVVSNENLISEEPA